MRRSGHSQLRAAGQPFVYFSNLSHRRHQNAFKDSMVLSPAHCATPVGSNGTPSGVGWGQHPSLREQRGSGNWFLGCMWKKWNVGGRSVDKKMYNRGKKSYGTTLSYKCFPFHVMDSERGQLRRGLSWQHLNLRTAQDTSITPPPHPSAPLHS